MSAAQTSPPRAINTKARKQRSAIGMVRSPGGPARRLRGRLPSRRNLSRFDDGVLTPRRMLAWREHDACRFGRANGEISQRAGGGARPFDGRRVGSAGARASHPAAETHGFRAGRPESDVAGLSEGGVPDDVGGGSKSYAGRARLARLLQRRNRWSIRQAYARFDPGL